MKTVRRRVLIREKDWLTKMRPDAQRLYSRVEWTPLNRADIEKENAWAVLSGEQSPWAVEFSWHQAFIRHSDAVLYNPRYNEWRVWCDHQGQLWIRPSNSNGKSQPLGIATLEFDY